jgi:hypothetical protein
MKNRYGQGFVEYDIIKKVTWMVGCSSGILPLGG